MKSAVSRAEESVPTGVPLKRVSFSELYNQHFDYVWRVVRGFGVSSDLAEDAVQDVFVVVHRRLDDFVPEASYKTWLFAVATRVASDYRRRVARKGPHVALEQAADVQSPAPDPYRTTLKMQVMARVERFLDTLDDERRAVFVLAEFGELTGPEIAATLQINLNTAYSRLRLAREQFAQAMGDVDPQATGEDHEQAAHR